MSQPACDWCAIAGTVVLLTFWNLIGRGAVPASVRPWANLALGLVIAGIGLLAGLGFDGLGLAKGRIGVGLLYGGIVMVVIAGVLSGASALSATAGFFSNPRTDVSASRLWFEALVTIPLGTVVLEELAFRGTLFGLARQRMSTIAAAIAVSVLFGLWHLQGVITSTSGGFGRVALACLGTFLATFVAGLGFTWLRVRSGSLVAPILAHIGTNSIALVVAWYAVH